MRLTQNNSVTVMQTILRNPSMQNRTILIQCDRALNTDCHAFKLKHALVSNKYRERESNGRIQ